MQFPDGKNPDDKIDSDKSEPSWLKKYYERGFRVIFYQSKQKGPSGQEAVGWPDRSDKLEDWKPGSNVGVFTGHEISPGKFLVDIDFDWEPGLPLAKRILPKTGFGFGRESRIVSHSIYTSSAPIPSVSFDNIDGKPFVELRGTKTDGTAGLQTMFPPSIHPSGETLALRMDGDIGHSEDILRLTTLYAISCMLFTNLGPGGFGHDTRLAVAGFLLQEGLTPDETRLLCESIAAVTGNSVPDMKTVLDSTIARFKTGQPIAGKGNLLKIFGDDGKRILARIGEWLGSKEFKEHKGKIIDTDQDNVRLALEKMDINLSFDLFSQKAMISYPGIPYGALGDTAVRKAWFEIDQKFHFRPPIQFFRDAIQYFAEDNPFHPVLDYFTGLVWDGVPRVDEWLIKTGGAADTPYVRAVSSIMLIAVCRRVTQPGCKYDEMVILESGEQGLLKSSALRALCPNEKWFSDDLPLNVDAKQMVERTLGKLMIEASDLSGMNASQVEHLKAMLSRQVDGPVRLAYGHLPVEQPRQFIIIGTTNSYTYLTDSTGNRRFWPIRVKKFDVAWIKENRDQLWAEAYAREQTGETIRLDPALYGHAALQQERRRAEDPWEVKLSETFSEDVKWRLTPDEVWAPLGISVDRRDSRSNDRVLKAMHKLGFKRLAVRNADNKVVKGFARDVVEGQMDLDRRTNDE